MIILCTFKNLLNNKKASKDIKKATKFLVEKKPSSKIGDIYTQIVMLNINMMLGGGVLLSWHYMYGKMILSQNLWLVFLPSYPFCFAFLALELKPIHHSQQNAIKQLKSLSIIIGQWKTVIGIIQNGYIYIALNQIICVCRENPSSSL